MAYLHLIYLNLKNALVYKLDTVIGVFASVLNLYMYLFLWYALLRNTDLRQLQEMVAYQVIGIFLIHCYDADVALLVGEKVMSGDIEMDFIKPYNYALSLLCGSIGRILGNLVKKGIPYILVAMLTTKFYKQINFEMLPAFCVAVIGAAFLYWLVFFIIGLLYFIFTSAKWFRKIVGDLIKILGGSVVPLWYFPEPLKNIVLFLPFWLMFQFPQSILSGKMEVWEIGKHLILLYGWTLVLVFFAWCLWKKAVKRITIQGG